MKKKAVMLMMLVALCVGMTACRGKNVSDSTEADTVTIEDEETPQAEDTESATEESEGEVTYVEVTYVEGTKEDFNLQELDNNELAITKYLGDAEYLIIPDNISGREIVEVSGFNSKDNLKGIVIPDTVKTIDDYAFNGCSNLESVTFGNNVETIEERAFTNCDALETVNFPDSLKSIGEGAFSGTSLNKIVIPTSVTVIEKGTFACNDGITEIVIPNNMMWVSKV